MTTTTEIENNRATLQAESAAAPAVLSEGDENLHEGNQVREEVDLRIPTNAEDENAAGDQQITMHPLENRWVFWFFKNDRQKEWADNLKRMIECSTVEGFWQIFNHITPPSKLPNGCDYSLFKDGIEPMWEDENNRHGGCWLITLDRSHRQDRLDKYWLTVLLLCIGEQFSNCMDEICGVTVNLRVKADRISIWTRSIKAEGSIVEIGKFLKDQLELTDAIQYNSHHDSQNKTCSKVKSLFTI